MSNNYQILGIKTSASIEEIKKAHRSLLLEYHPDRNKAEEAAAKSQEINAAFDAIMASKSANVPKNKNPTPKYKRPADFKTIDDIKEYLSAGRSIDEKTPPLGDTLLILAIRNNRLDFVEFLLLNGAQVDLTNFAKNTPLMEACLNKDLDFSFKAAKLLIEKRANLDLKTGKGYTALMMAASNKNTKLVEELLVRGVDSKLVSADNKTAKDFAIQAGAEGSFIDLFSAKEIEYLLGSGKLSEALDIMQEVSKDQLGLLFSLPQVNLNKANKLGVTLLILAAKTANLSCLQLLLEKKVDINHKDGAGNTALLMASNNADKDYAFKATELLIKKGAKANDCNFQRQTAISNAIWHKNVKLVELLFDNQADLNHLSRTELITIKDYADQHDVSQGLLIQIEKELSNRDEAISRLMEDSTVTATQLSAGAEIVGTKIANTAITSAKIANTAITSAKIADTRISTNNDAIKNVQPSISDRYIQYLHESFETLSSNMNQVEMDKNYINKASSLKESIDYLNKHYFSQVIGSTALPAVIGDAIAQVIEDTAAEVMNEADEEMQALNLEMLSLLGYNSLMDEVDSL